MHIPVLEIERVVNNRKNYVVGENKRLRFIEYDYVEDDCLLVSGTINDYYGNSCKVKYNYETEKITEYECDCSYCTDKSACGHIFALLKTFNSINPTTIPGKQEFDKSGDEVYIKNNEEELINRKKNASKYFIESIKGDREILPITIPLKNKLSIEPKLIETGYYPRPFLEFKIGNNKMYVVKDIYLLLYDIENENYVNFGKELKLIIRYDDFDDESKLIIDFLNLYKTNSYSYSKRFPITEKSIKDFFDIFKSNKKINYKFIEEKAYVKASFEKVNLGYNFKLSCGYEIENEDSYFIDYKKNIVTHVMLHGGKEIVKFYKKYSGMNIFILEEDMDELYKYGISNIVEYIDIDGYIFDDIPEEKIEVYGDIVGDNQIGFTLVSIYDDENKVFGFTNEKINKSTEFERIESFIMHYSSFIDKENYRAIMNIDDENTHIFNDEGIPILQKYCDVYVSEALKGIKYKQKYTVSVGVAIKNDLLSIDFSSIDIPLEELGAVLKAYKKRKKFFKLKNGKILNIESDDLQELDELVDDYDIDIDDLNNGHADISLYRTLSMDKAIDCSTNLNFKKDDTFKKLIENFDKKTDDFRLKEKYKSILRYYQIQGVNWINKLRNLKFGGILADDMGLGKTLQVISLIDSLNTEGANIVVCPASLILNWVDEVEKFSSSMKCVGIFGSSEAREEIIKHIDGYKLVITSYDYIKRDINLYKDIEFDYVILDEGQYIKNQNTKNAQSVKKLKGKYKLILTGTPIENSLAELWSLFDFLMPGYLYSYFRFRRKFEIPIIKENDESVKNQLKRLVEPFILRRNKKDVLKEIPDKIEQTITIDFIEEEKKIYHANLALISEELKDSESFDGVDKIKVLAMLTRLRQLCLDARLVYSDINTPSAKMDAALDIINTYKENNKKILLFSSFTSIFDLMIPILNKEKIKFHILTGETNKIERRRLVYKFQEDNSTLFLISLKAGGTGLNLTSAEGVIHFDPWWNLSAQNQATDRSHRIGQVNNVNVYKLIMKNSIEEKILKIQERKKFLSDTFIEGNEGSISRMTKDEILELFKY